MPGWVPKLASKGECSVGRIRRPFQSFLRKNSQTNYWCTSVTVVSLITARNRVSEKYEALCTSIATEGVEEHSDGHLLFPRSRKTAFLFRKPCERRLLFHVVISVEHPHCLRDV